jgi:hypothetical protein
MTVSGGPAPRDHGEPGGRVTLAGVVERPAGDERGAARDAHLAGVPAAKYYIDELRPATVELVRQATAVTKERGPNGGGP